MKINNYLDSTYLKLSSQSGLTEDETKNEVVKIINEAIENKFYLVMIRPEYVKLAKELISQENSEVKVGTVIGFHEGTYRTEEKISEAEKAIADGVDELDYVINYEAFIQGETERVKKEFIEGTKTGLEAGKVVKWIIEVAALSDQQIQDICTLISNTAQENFTPQQYADIFVKSSTGFYKTEGGKPNGATFPTVEIMLKYSNPLPVKAAGGVRSYEEAVRMIEMGVKRIGTSSAKSLIAGEKANTGY